MFQQCLSAAMEATNKPVPAAAAFDSDRTGNVHLLIMALDYKQTSNPLTCTMDGRNMQELARACGVNDVEVMFDEECTSANVTSKVIEMSQRCEPDDYFIFYYSGHGTNVADQSGDEADGQDEAFCFVDANGQISYETIMTDDTFAELITENLNSEVRILILTDCCHSGTIADLSKSEWDDFEAISITGCMDSQTSGDVGTGGIFTHSMLLAIENLKKSDDAQDEYSVGMLYNTTLAFDDKVFNSAQDITIGTTKSVKPNAMMWPLVPQQPYVSPMTKAQGGNRDVDLGGMASGMAGGALGAAGLSALVQSNPGMLQSMGIPPAVAGIAVSGIAAYSDDGKIDMSEITEMGMTAAGAQGCVTM